MEMEMADAIEPDREPTEVDHSVSPCSPASCDPHDDANGATISDTNDLMMDMGDVADHVR